NRSARLATVVIAVEFRAQAHRIVEGASRKIAGLDLQAGAAGACLLGPSRQGHDDPPAVALPAPLPAGDHRFETEEAAVQRAVGEPNGLARCGGNGVSRGYCELTDDAAIGSGLLGSMTLQG